MFLAMKSKRRFTEHKPEPCPCNNSCRCHQPVNTDVNYAVWGIGFFFIVAIMIFGTMALIYEAWNHRNDVPSIEHIQVNGQDCTIKWITDSCTSTGACSSHRVATCPQ
jgi:hypothetical protein